MDHWRKEMNSNEAVAERCTKADHDEKRVKPIQMLENMRLKGKKKSKLYKDDSEAATIENATGQNVSSTEGSISNDETHDTTEAIT